MGQRHSSSSFGWASKAVVKGKSGRSTQNDFRNDDTKAADLCAEKYMFDHWTSSEEGDAAAQPLSTTNGKENPKSREEFRLNPEINRQRATDRFNSNKTLGGLASQASSTSLSASSTSATLSQAQSLAPSLSFLTSSTSAASLAPSTSSASLIAVNNGSSSRYTKCSGVDFNQERLSNSILPLLECDREDSSSSTVPGGIAEHVGPSLTFKTVDAVTAATYATLLPAPSQTLLASATGVPSVKDENHASTLSSVDLPPMPGDTLAASPSASSAICTDKRTLSTPHSFPPPPPPPRPPARLLSPIRQRDALQGATDFGGLVQPHNSDVYTGGVSTGQLLPPTSTLVPEPHHQAAAAPIAVHATIAASTARGSRDTIREPVMVAAAVAQEHCALLDRRFPPPPERVPPSRNIIHTAPVTNTATTIPTASSSSVVEIRSTRRTRQKEAVATTVTAARTTAVIVPATPAGARFAAHYIASAGNATALTTASATDPIGLLGPAPPVPGPSTGPSSLTGRRLTVPLGAPVLGLTELHVMEVPLADVRPEHDRWLREGWESLSPPAPRVVGFDTEFIGDQLALVQLCCGNRALLVTVPPSRRQQQQQQQQQRGSGAASGAGPSTGAKGKRKQAGVRKEQSATSGSGVQRDPDSFPFSWPGPLRTLLCDPVVPKAAAEAWQDAIMLFAAFGIKLRNGLDLTVACPPSTEEKERGRVKLSLFAIFERFFPQSPLRKDRTIDHSKWHRTPLDERQLKYGALDAFVSYAAGVRVMHLKKSSLPRSVDLTRPAHWEVVLAANWVHVQQFLEASQPEKTKHDFQNAEFTMHKKHGLVLEVCMARYKTRLRQNCWVELSLAGEDAAGRPRRIGGKCTHATGKKATVAKLKWLGGDDGSKGRDVKQSEVCGVTNIEMEEVADNNEEEALKNLFSKLLRGEDSLSTSPLARAIFSGGNDSDVSATTRTSSRRAPATRPSIASTSSTNVVMTSTTTASTGGGAPPTSSASGAGGDGCGRLSTTAEATLSCLKSQPRVNPSQAAAIEAVLRGRHPVQLVQGPPGTGKTTVISHVVALWLWAIAPELARVGADRRREALACVARSNVAAKNMALALIKRGLGPKDFRLVVSFEYHFEWHEEQYRGELEAVLITSDELKNEDMPRKLEGVRVFVTTVSMLANPNFNGAALYGKALTRLMVDEASQIYAGDLALPLVMYGKSLRLLALFGDDMQLPPYGSEWNGAYLPSMFDHLSPTSCVTGGATGGGGGSGSLYGAAVKSVRPQPNAFSVGPALVQPRRQPANGSGVVTPVAERLMLAVTYRLPPLLCGFISREMYGGQLVAGRAGDDGSRSIRWINLVGKEERRGGPSTCNPREAEALCRIIASEYGDSSWTVITGYDLQRTLLERRINTLRLKRKGVALDNGGGADRVYNIDTFQGREDEVVLVSLVRSGTSPGFMKDDRRVNVMLTRCSHKLVILGNVSWALSNPDTLIGRIAVFCTAQGMVEAQQATR